MIESLEYGLVAAWSGLAFISLCGFAWESIQSLRLRSSEIASREEDDSLPSAVQFELEVLP